MKPLFLTVAISALSAFIPPSAFAKAQMEPKYICTGYEHRRDDRDARPVKAKFEITFVDGQIGEVTMRDLANNQKIDGIRVRRGFRLLPDEITVNGACPKQTDFLQVPEGFSLKSPQALVGFQAEASFYGMSPYWSRSCLKLMTISDIECRLPLL